jgi:hypothetical protein
MSNKKITPVESIAARLASRQLVVSNEPYESVFSVGPPPKEFGIMTRSIPVSKSKNSTVEPNKRGTQMNFYS